MSRITHDLCDWLAIRHRPRIIPAAKATKARPAPLDQIAPTIQPVTTSVKENTLKGTK
jgi:hypothetical protein